MQEFTVVLDAEKKFKTAVSFIVHVYILSHHRPMLHFVLLVENWWWETAYSSETAISTNFKYLAGSYQTAVQV